jgi:2-keto-4-pentenoate hydratase/2-oxohepta-3-ene-1,7-dioic acid hydratase in catechol pathway
MKLATIRTPQGPRAAVLAGDSYIDLHATRSELAASVRGLLEGGPDVLAAAARVTSLPEAVRYPASAAQLLPPVPDPQKIICIGRNYREHAAESGSAVPREPVLFSKYNTALIGHEEPIVLPPVSREVDYEAELVLVLGCRGRNLTRQNAVNYLAGYTIGHDVSARDWQFKKDGKQWMAGKTFDTFAPTGPWLLTTDEVPDPHAMGIRLRLNGRVMQESNTAQMIFRAGALLAYISQVVTLMPGDLIFTGTPSGVGFTRQPPVFLKAGDVVEIEIDGLGLLRNPVVQG